MKACASGLCGWSKKRRFRRRQRNPCVWSSDRNRASAFVEAYDYLMDFNPRAAIHLAESLLEAGDSLNNFPHRGRLVRGTGMRELVTVSPYIIRYRVTADTVIILRVRHEVTSSYTPLTRTLPLFIARVRASMSPPCMARARVSSVEVFSIQRSTAALR